MPDIPNFNDKFLLITKKELFYTAAMLQLRQLVNIVYDFPADEARFDKELNEARASLRKKKLLTESARGGTTLDFALIVCAIFCSAPETCEIIDSNGYRATIYNGGGVSLLLEKRSEDELASILFANREKLDQYVNSKLNERTGE